MKKDKFDPNDFIKCEKCGYCNKKYFIQKYGTCNCCKNVLDPKAKFEYDMVNKLKLWKRDKNKYGLVKNYK